MLINDWGLMNMPCDPYTAPECRSRAMVLHGTVTAHRKLGSGRITSSKIVKVAGKLVFTHSGSCYKLGTPNESWSAYLEDKGWVATHEEPIPAELLKLIGL